MTAPSATAGRSTTIAGREPSDGSEPTRREDDLRCWGLACGLALGLRFAEEPEDRERAAEEAFWAAKTAFKAWAGPIAPRPDIAPLTDSMLALWDGAVAEFERQRREWPDGWIAFSEAIKDLQDALGMPAPAVDVRDRLERN